MKCIYCGHELDKTMTVCPKCKAAVPKKDKKEPEKDSKDKEE